MSPGATFERVYRALKARLGSGACRATQALEPSLLAAELNASITPVRDALHRLVGERLVEAPSGDGFRVPALTELGLRHLYRWNQALLSLAVGGSPAARPAPRPRDSLVEAEGAEELFATIAARSGSPEHLLAILNLNDRLRPIRRAEALFLADWRSELDEMRRAAAPAAPPGLRRLLAAYHRRRERIAPEIVAALQPSG